MKILFDSTYNELIQELRNSNIEVLELKHENTRIKSEFKDKLRDLKSGKQKDINKLNEVLLKELELKDKVIKYLIDTVESDLPEYIFSNIIRDMKEYEEYTIKVAKEFDYLQCVNMDLKRAAFERCMVW